jgi:hypothetical protein
MLGSRQGIAHAHEHNPLPQAVAVVAPAVAAGATGPHGEQAVSLEGLVTSHDRRPGCPVVVVEEAGRPAGLRLHDDVEPGFF